MPKQFPEHIEDIEAFYRSAFKDKSIAVPDANWAGIEHQLAQPTATPNVNIQTDPTITLQTATKVMTLKGGLGLASIAGVVAIAGASVFYYVTQTSTKAQPPSIENNDQTAIISADTLASIPDSAYINSENGVVASDNPAKAEIEKSIQPQIADAKITDKDPKLPVVHSPTLAIDTSHHVEMAKEKVTPAKQDSMLTKEIAKEEKKESYFERKLKQQKDTSSHIFRKK